MEQGRGALTSRAGDDRTPGRGTVTDAVSPARGTVGPHGEVVRDRGEPAPGTYVAPEKSAQARAESIRKADTSKMIAIGVGAVALGAVAIAVSRSRKKR